MTTEHVNKQTTFVDVHQPHTWTKDAVPNKLSAAVIAPSTTQPARELNTWHHDDFKRFQQLEIMRYLGWSSQV